MPRLVYGDNRTATCYLALLSAFFPPGEDFFVKSVNRYSHLVTDPKLRAEVAGFTGQEVIHSREHERLNEVFTLRRGFSLGVPDRAIRAALALLYRLPARQQLACTAFMEHFTALLAEETLNYEGGDGDERLLAELYVLVTVGPAAVVAMLWLLLTEGALVRPGDLVRGVRMLLGPGKSLPKVLRGMPRWRRPDFHPNRRDTTAMEQEWRERLFGTDGSLTGQLRRPVA
jgi:hypothetical protein